MSRPWTRLTNRSGYAGVLQFLAFSLISAAIMGALYMAFSSSQASWMTADAVMAAQGEARRVLYTINLDLRGSGNTPTLTHLRVQDPPYLTATPRCPGLVYQLPLDSLPGAAQGWGASDNPPTLDRVVWIHRATLADGTRGTASVAQSLCNGPFLVRQVFAPGSGVGWPTFTSGPNQDRANLHAAPPDPAVAIPISSRVLATGLTDPNPTGGIFAFETRALTTAGTLVSWWPITLANAATTWRPIVSQVEIVIRVRRPSLANRLETSTQQMRIRLRNGA